jgi:two-component system response regulator HydG
MRVAAAARRPRGRGDGTHRLIQDKRVMLLDEDVEGTQALAQKLLRYGYFCEIARTVDAALSILARGTCDAMLCDAGIALRDDAQLLERMKHAFARLPVIVLAADGVIEDAVHAIQHGASQYLAKSSSIDELHRHIRHAIALWQESPVRRPPAHDATARAGALVGESAAMKALMQNIAQVALSSAPVLIVGESGTGKERVARAIHAAGPRHAHAFVAVNMAAIPEQLIESELFGHSRGAYTGATQPRAGLFAEAEGGTLLLDEIGDMPKLLQPKILRILQSGEIRPVGSDRTRHVDVRIIAATHRDLDAMIRDDQFRDDLRYRLNTLVLRVPPLRERPEDIAPLARQFLLEARARTPSSRVTSITDEALALLQKAPWPGNIRELESAVERAVVLGRGTAVTPDELFFVAAPTPGPVEPSNVWPQSEGRHYTLRQMNHRYLDWVLEQTHGDKARAAEVLGIDVSTLYRWQRAKN